MRTHTTPADSPLMVNSVHKAFRVLTAFSSQEPRLTLTQIKDRLGVDKSTAQRFTHTLTAMGYLDKDPATKTLGVTVKVLDLAHVFLATNPLIAAALPYMMHLNRETDETVNLAMLDASDVVFVSRIVGSDLLATGVVIGTRIPAYTSASGIAMLSRLDAATVEQLLDATTLRQYTAQTVTDPAKIRERLSVAAAKGYAVTTAEYYLNDISVGAPIVSKTGQLLGAVSLAVSNGRFTVKEAETKFSRLVAAAAKSITL